MATTPHVSSDSVPSEHVSSFSDSVLSLMRALLAARDPGAHPASRIPLVRVGEAENGALDAAHCPHVRIDI
jgi:hypothetical protein